MSIRTQVTKAIDKVFSSGKADTYIQEAAEKAIKSSIENAFRSYGTVGEQIEKMLTESLNLHMPSFNLQAYNHTIANIVQKEVLFFLEEEAQRTIKERLTHLLKPAPKEITVQEIVDRHIDIWKDYDAFDLNPEIMIKTSDWSPKSRTIKLWKKGRYYESFSGTRREKEPDMDIYISDKQILLPRLQTDVFTVKAQFQLETFVYMMALCGTEITDIYDVEEEDIVLDVMED